MTQTRLSEIRKKRGIAVSDLAKRVGVSRQTIYAIEDGSYVPNTTIALQLAHALEVTVEDLFSLDQPGSSEGELLRAEPLGKCGSETRAGELVRLCRVGNRLIAIPIPSLPAYLPVADAVVQKRSGREVSVKSFVDGPEYDNRFLVAGCDPALSLLTDSLAVFGIEIVCISCPSHTALQWLKEGRVHAAGSHLLDRASGQYNLPFIRRAFPKASVRVVTFASWEQGIVVQQGNPQAITGISDLHRKDINMMNRETGSGSRDLLDAGLTAAGLSFGKIRGYDDIAEGHLPAAYAVATRKADLCIATRSAARRFGLDFIPLAAERFDLTFSRESLALPSAKALLEALAGGAFRNKLRLVAGYQTEQTGVVQL